VPVAQATASNIFGISSGTYKPFFSFTLSVDTTGLGGKVIPVYAAVNGMFANGTIGTETAYFQLLINGTLTQGYSITVPTSQSALLVLSGAVNITASGAVMSVPVVAQFGSSNQSVVAAGTTIYAQAAKR
jgi:hypothetical protein